MRVLVGNGKDGHVNDSYVCQTGYHVRRSRPDLDDLVTRIVVARLALPDAATALARDDGQQSREANERASALRARLDLAADSYAEGNIDARQLTRITAKLRPEMEQWERTARAATTAPDLRDLAGPDIAKRWAGLPLARKRAVIDLLVDIKVDRARHGGLNAFDPESIRIEWRTS
jgi:hypothetical protein